MDYCDFAKFQEQHLILFSKLTPQSLLLNDLCHQYPTGYVEFKDAGYFYPIRLDLYKSDYLNKILEIYKNGSFAVKTHNNLPIVLSCDSIELQQAFIILNLQLITGSTPKIVCSTGDSNWNTFIEYLHLLNYFIDSDQMDVLMRDIVNDVSSDIYLSLLELNIDLKNFLPFDKKIKLCEEYYKKYNIYRTNAH